MDLLTFDRLFGNNINRAHYPTNKPGPRNGRMQKTELHQCNILPLKLSNCEIVFKVDSVGQCFAVKKQKSKETETYTGIYSILSSQREITQQQRWEDLAVLLNFFTKGEEFTVITDPKQFRKEYRENLQKATDPFSDKPDLTAYGKFDLEEIDIPKGIEDNTMLRFYARKNMIPYRVTFYLPIDSDHPKCKYEILNYL